jgi:hypothetical protein
MGIQDGYPPHDLGRGTVIRVMVSRRSKFTSVFKLLTGSSPYRGRLDRATAFRPRGPVHPPIIRSISRDLTPPAGQTWVHSTDRGSWQGAGAGGFGGPPGGPHQGPKNPPGAP